MHEVIESSDGDRAKRGVIYHEVPLGNLASCDIPPFTEKELEKELGIGDFAVAEHAGLVIARDLDAALRDLRRP